MAWWMRPGPSRFWARAKPWPMPASPPTMFSNGTRTSSYRISAWPPGSPVRWSGSPIVGTSRRMFTPGVSVGTMIIENDWYGLSSSSPVLTITSRKSDTDALDENHLWPLMTHSSPSRTAVVVSSVGSAPAPGSVIEKHERYLPSSSGCIHRSFCSSVPPTAISSALPESGALLPKMLGP